MSKELSSYADSGSGLDRLLAEIDAAYKEFSASAAASLEGFTKGPFGVFNGEAVEEQSKPDKEIISIPTDDQPIEDSADHPASGEIHNEGEEDIPRPDWLGQLNGIELDDFSTSLEGIIGPPAGTDGEILDASLLLDPALTSFDMEFDANHSDSFGSNMGWMSPTLNQSFWSETTEKGDLENNVELGSIRQSRVPSPRASTPSRGISNIPEHAETLLRFYKQYSSSSVHSVRKSRKSALQTIFLPCALETFSELVLWNTTSHTRLAILPTLCAHSAFLLHRSKLSDNSQSDWWTIGTKYLKRAQNHLQQALQCELTGPDKASYEELLMAILALAMTSVSDALLSLVPSQTRLVLVTHLNGLLHPCIEYIPNVSQFYHNTKVAKIYLLDAERLIRLSGFEQAHHCNNARLLHHMYTHLRIFSESVCSFDITSSLNSGSEAGSLSVARSRAFRIAEDSLNTGLDSSLEKSKEVGLKDIHLELQGRWSRTMYPMIYGIPESIMTLVAQTVSLANEKNQLQSIASQNPQTSAALTHHIKSLEQSVWSWSVSNEFQITGPQQTPALDGLEGDDHEGLLDHHSKHLMTMALHQSLIIYFYRRVHCVNAMLLQDAVLKALHYLDSCVEDMIRDHDLVPSLAWAAFIAASEAVTMDLQERALKLLGLVDNLGFFFTPNSTKETVSKIWEMRKQTGDMTIGWSAVIEE